MRLGLFAAMMLVAGLGHAATPAAEPAGHGEAPAAAGHGETADAAAGASGTIPEENIPTLANERAFSASELEVLQSLEEKRVALERRAQALELREKLVDMLEERLAGRIGELDTLRTEIENMMRSASGKDEEQLKQLATVYGAMKPTAAALVLNRLDNTLVQDVVERLPSKKAGKLMEALNPAKARRISEMMAAPVPVPNPNAGGVSPTASAQ